MKARPGCLKAWSLTTCLAATFASAGPMLSSVTVDGEFADWAEILTNEENVARDGDGSSTGCSGSTDADCPILASEHDLVRIAWTWDVQHLAMYLELLDAGVDAKYAFVYIDVANDGVMGADDFLALLTLDDLPSPADMALHAYVPSSPAGDPLVDPSGSGDGWDLPGSAGQAVTGNVGALGGPGPDGRTWELELAWTKMTLAAGSPIGLHFSISRGPVPAVQIEDNGAATDGRALSTVHRGIEVGPARAASVAPGGRLWLAHEITTLGNAVTRGALRIVSSTGHDLEIWSDVDADGRPDDWVATDAGGDGILSLPGDMVAPGFDPDGDGLIDGLLAPGSRLPFVVQEDFTLGDAGLTERISLSVWVLDAPGSGCVIEDVVSVGDVTLAPEGNCAAVAGDLAWLAHSVQSNVGFTAAVDFSVLSGRGWIWEMLLDPNADGDPTDAVPLTDGDGSGRVDVTLASGASAAVFARARVPAGASLGTQELGFVRAHLNGSIESFVQDRVVVEQPIYLLPSHLQAFDAARYGGAGGSIYFSHRLSWNGGHVETFSLTASTDLGWPVALLADPDGDGRPQDAVPLPSTFAVAQNGGQLAFLARVDVPAGTRLGEIARATIRAVAASDGSSAVVEDDAIAAIVRVYDDPAHSINVQRLPACSTAYALASGLRPSAGGYRFAWRDAAGPAFRVQDVVTDARGSCQDAAILPPTTSGAGHRAEIQVWDGMSWTTLDSARFAVGDAWRLSELLADPPQLDLRAETLSAVAMVANDAYDQPLGTELRWVVLAPDRSTYLAADGTFQPWSGIEATRRASVTLEAREQRPERLVAGCVLPAPGIYHVEAWRHWTCLGERLEASATLEVVDDADGDGLDGTLEIANGLDPRDDDSDDDGLADGLEGLGDSDGDGVVDGRDCDSDGDGLGDGLEAGAWRPLQGTDPASPCWVIDASPTTRTDPDLADTDGGGAGDGQEDADGNGGVDAGERDPLDPGDDARGCSPTPPPEVLDLRVGRDAMGRAVLRWVPQADPCVSYRVLSSESLPDFRDAAAGLVDPSFVDAATGPLAGLRCFAVRATSWFSGEGP